MRKSAGLLRAAVLVAWAMPAAAQPAGVFLPATATASQVDGEQRLVRISRSELAAARRDAQRQGAGRLAFNVADDLLIPAVVERTGRTPWGYSLSGRVDAPRGGTVTLVVHADVVSGTIWTPGGAWEIEPVAGDVHALRKVDPRRRRQGAEPLRMMPEPKGPDTAAAGMDDGTVVDVLVLWTPGTLALAGTEARLNIAIDLAVSTTNDAFENSGVDLQLNLVGAEQVDYASSGNGGVDLDRLRDPADGFMDAVHARRDALGADLVSLLVDESNVGGIAYVLKRFNAAFRSFAFSLVWYGQGPYHRSITFAHELGHNMGLAHDRYVADENDGIFGHSHGYVNLKAFEAGAEADACWLTIMAYDNRCDDAGFEAPLAVAYFSTPHRVYPDEAGDAEPAPLGVPKDSDAEHADGPADAVLTLASTRFVVANFRAERTDDGDARGAATPIGANATVVGDIEGPGDVDFYRIEVAQAGTLRIETAVLRPSRPPASDGSGFASGVGCALQNSAGETVAADDGAADGETPWPGWVASCEASVGPGVYYVRLATGSGTDGTGPYTLTVAFDPRTAGDHGDTAGAATPLTLPATVAANLATETDVDYFRFSLPTTAALRVATTGSADTLGILTELAAVGPPLRLTDDDSGPGANFYIESKAPRGDYLLRVASGGGSGDYVLEVAASTAADDHADSAADATPLAVGTALGGELEVANDLDYFRIDVPRAGQLWLTTEGDTDTMGELFSAAGESLADNDDGPVWPHFLVGVDASPGAYLLRVRGWSTSTGPYTVRAIYHADDRAVALFPSGAGLRLDGGGAGQLGFARLINRSSEPGVVFLSAADDAGRAFGPAELKLPAGRSVHFNSRSLATGDVPGLEGGLAQAEVDDLRLTLETELDVEALAYVRTGDGFVTTMHETAPRHAGGTYRVAFFNPASNRNQRSLLRVANAGARVAEVTLTGIDDAGTPGEDALVFYVPPDGVRVLSAEALETGDAPFDLFGRLGDGTGKWELSLEADGDPRRRRHQNGFAPLRVMSLLASPTGNVTNLSTVPAAATGRIDVPLFLAAAGAAEDAGQQGFLRVINDSAVGGEVAIHAIDDAGERFGPVALRMGAGQRIHFNSTHLESGNAAIGLAGIGDGAGHWRLELNTSLTLTVLAYVRTRDGFVTSVHDRVPAAADGRHEVVFFNPGSNANQVSWLRLVNPGAEPAAVTIEGIDDMGEPAPEGAVTLTLAAGAAAKLTAAELEAGAPRFAGRLGDGAGKWRLSVRADQAIWVMSLLESPTGNLTNLSTRTLAAAADDGAP